ncbi:MAG: hypothetical protein KC912_23195 [Proteobacteria bacterium]|nr:hypothetical protein [Pseudomonadota bacterium]
MRILAVTVLLALSACAGDEEIEGDEAGECSDGADNDQDAYFDCDDNGCWNSPDCDGGETDTDTDTDSDSDSDADADSDADSDSDTDVDCSDDSNSVFAHVNSIDLSMVLDVDFDEENTFCGFLIDNGVGEDCSMTWTGTAANVVERCRPPERVTMSGTFSRTASTCYARTPTAGGGGAATGEEGIMEQGTWGNTDGDPSGYVSLIMSEDDPGFIETVIGHGIINRWEPNLTSPIANQQYYETDILGETFVRNQTTFNYVFVDPQIFQNCSITYTSTVDFTINP